MIRKGFHNVGSEDAGGWFIVDEIPEALRLEMDEAVNMLLYDMYANEPFSDWNTTFINKQFKYQYSEEFIEYTINLIKEHEDNIRKYHATNIKHFDFNNLVTTSDKNNEWYTGPNGGWVTMQDRFEFCHPHTGNNLFNFMYYGRVPYLRTNTKLTSPNTQTDSSILGSDYILAPNNVGKISNSANQKSPPNRLEVISLENTSLSNGHILILPHYLYRGSNPFYCTEEYKITYKGELGEPKPNTFL